MALRVRYLNWSLALSLLSTFSLSQAYPLSPTTAAAVEEDAGAHASSGSELWFDLGAAIVLVLVGGIFAGLTIALMGQDAVHLEVLATSGEKRERRHAGIVLCLLARGKHWVLVTLLLGNVVVNETLPIILDKSLGGGWPAILGSTVLIVIFGEVIPQSVCVRYGLSIGAYLSPLVLFLMFVFAPVAWPTAKLLDWLLGASHGVFYKKAGLKTLVTLHKTLGTQPAERLIEDEVTIISAVLDLKDKPVEQVMTPMKHVLILSSDTILDEDTMNLILSAGYSRIPIHVPGHPSDFVGMLLVKTLITYDPEDAKCVGDFALATLPETRPETSCLDILNYFQEGHSHMVLVSENPTETSGALGVVTLEDVIEELIGEEIVDESDVYIDVHKSIKRLAPAPRVVQARNDPWATKNTQKLVAQNLPGPKEHRLRRVSTAPITGAGYVDTITPEQRRHLDHLAPSNLATSPKQTRFANVKIKSVARDNIADGTRRDNNGGSSSAYQSKEQAERKVITKGSSAVDEGTPLLGSQTD